MLPRLLKEKAQLQKEGYKVVQNTGTEWSVYVVGPQTTPFEGGNFEIKFVVQNFPFTCPLVSFKTQIYHPNVDTSGQICPEMLELGVKWAPTKKLLGIMEKINSLMVMPNIQAATNQPAAKDYKNNTWRAKAKQYTLQYAK